MGGWEVGEVMLLHYALWDLGRGMGAMRDLGEGMERVWLLNGR